MGLIKPDDERDQHDRETVRFEHPTHFAHRFAIVRAQNDVERAIGMGRHAGHVDPLVHGLAR